MRELACHNEKRRLHGTDPLVLNAALHESAQKYADQLASHCGSLWGHSRWAEPGTAGTPMGENLYTQWVDNSVHPNANLTLRIAGDAACEAWYGEEERYYDYASNDGTPTQPRDHMDRPTQVGHFAQIVWRKSRQMGVGVACCNLPLGQESGSRSS